MQGFKEVLTDIRAEELNVISSQLEAGGMSRDEMSDALIRSAKKTKRSAVVDLPLYKIARWFRTHGEDIAPGQGRYIDLVKKIVADAGIPLSTVRYTLEKFPWKSPVVKTFVKEQQVNPKKKRPKKPLDPQAKPSEPVAPVKPKPGPVPEPPEVTIKIEINIRGNKVEVRTA